jgi:hypothetical protein
VYVQVDLRRLVLAESASVMCQDLPGMEAPTWGEHSPGDLSDGGYGCKSEFYAKTLDTIQGQKEGDGGFATTVGAVLDASSMSCNLPRSTRLPPLNLPILHLFR